MSGSSSPMPEQVGTTHVVGIDIGMESCTMSRLTMDKRQVIKPTPFANTLAGFDWLFEGLEGLGVAPKQMVVGLEATSRDARESVAGPAAAVATRSACYIRPKCMLSHTNAGCERKRISWMRSRSRERCSAEKHVSAMCRASRWRPTES
jgi:hypothetical protein